MCKICSYLGRPTFSQTLLKRTQYPLYIKKIITKTRFSLDYMIIIYLTFYNKNFEDYQQALDIQDTSHGLLLLFNKRFNSKLYRMA